MDKAVLERKRQILALITQVKSASATIAFRHEMMTYVYVLANGAIEYMVETILREWVANNVKKHANSKRYQGKVFVSKYLSTSTEISNKTIDDFHSPSYGKIVDLIRNVAGDHASESFKDLVKASRVTEPELDAKLQRINNFRHRLAHGKAMPSDTQPNIDELGSDFKSVYEHIIHNLDRALQKRK